MLTVHQAICKECGNGTLNNETNPQFTVEELEYNEACVICNVCDSTRVEAVVVYEADEDEAYEREVGA